MRRERIARSWEDWLVVAALILFAAGGVGVLLWVLVDSVVLTVAAFAVVGATLLLRVVGAFGH